MFYDKNKHFYKKIIFSINEIQAEMG